MKVFTVRAVLALAALIFPGLAQAQMRHVGGDYYRDSAHIYVKVKSVDNSLFSGLFSGLDNYTFERVVGADPGSFVPLEDGYAKDKNYVYNGQRLDNVDVRTFERIGKGFYRISTTSVTAVCFRSSAHHRALNQPALIRTLSNPSGAASSGIGRASLLTKVSATSSPGTTNMIITTRGLTCSIESTSWTQ